MTNVLVTGGAGFIGSALVKRLLTEGYRVRVLDDYSRGVPRRLQEVAGKIEIVRGDVCDPVPVDAATRGMDMIFHLAAVNGTENFYQHPDRVLEVGVKGTINTMDAAIKHGCQRYLLASSSEVYQEPVSLPTDEAERLVIPDVQNPRFSYSGSKIIGELLAVHYLARRGVNAVIIRPHNVYGPGVNAVIIRPHNVYGPDMGQEHVIPQFALRLAGLKETGSPGPAPFPIQGDGSQTRAFCYIDDAVAAILLVAQSSRSGEIYHIGVDQEIAIAELAAMMASITEIEIKVVPGDKPAGGTSRRCPNISKIRKLGFEPRVSLEDGLRKTCAWYAQAFKESQAGMLNS